MQGKVVVNIENFIWTTLIISIAGHVIFDMVGMQIISSLCFYGIYIVLFAYILYALKRYKIYRRKEPFWLMLAIMGLSFIVVLMGTNSLSVDYLKKMLMFWGTIIMIAFSFKCYIKENVKRIFKVALQVMVACFVFKTFISPEYYGSTSFYSMGLSNSNIAGMWIFALFSGIFWCFMQATKWNKKIFYLVEMTLSTYMCFLTECRSAILAIVLMIIVFVFFFKTEKINPICAIINVALPVVFPFVYMWLYNQEIDFEIVGIKSFYSGRQRMWAEAFALLNKHPFRGVYYEISDGTGTSQLHNIFVDVVSSYGIFVFILVWGLLGWCVSYHCKSLADKAQKLILISFMLVLFIGCFEASFFAGGAGIGIWSCVFLCMMHSKPQTMEEKANI